MQFSAKVTMMQREGDIL